MDRGAARCRRDEMDDPGWMTSEFLECTDTVVRSARRHARSGADSADDLVQEAWLVALGSPPRHEENLRGWFGAVVRRLALKTNRARTRRERREREVARPETAPDGDLGLERERLCSLIVEAVEGLREPYREVVLRRFLLDHPPRHIAAELERPVKTVKSQIARGMSLLRDRLSTHVDKDGRSLLGAIGLWCARLEARPVRSALLSARFAARFAAGTAFVTLLLVGVRFVTPPTDVRRTRAAAAALDGHLVTAALAVPAPDARRAVPSAAALAPPRTEAPRTVHVTTLDEFGRPIAFGSVERWDAGRSEFVALGATGPDGSARFVLDPDWGTSVVDFARPPTRSDISSSAPGIAIRMVAPGRTPSDALWIDDAIDSAALEIGPTAVRIAGIVLDEAGRPIERARVRRVEAQRPPRRTGAGHLAVVSPCETRTDAQGRFALEDAPAGLSWVIAEAEGYGPSATREIRVSGAPHRPEGERTARLVLHRSAGVHGVVFGSAGEPVADARIIWRDTESLLRRETRSDVDGVFALADLPSGRSLLLEVESVAGSAATRLELEPGEARNWSPALEAGACAPDVTDRPAPTSSPPVGDVRLVVLDECGARLDDAVILARRTQVDGVRTLQRHARRRAGERDVLFEELPVGRWSFVALVPGRGCFELGTALVREGQVSELGERFAPPGGLLELEWGWPVDAKANDRGTRVEFEIAQIGGDGTIAIIDRGVAPHGAYAVFPGAYRIEALRGRTPIARTWVRVDAFGSVTASLAPSE